MELVSSFKHLEHYTSLNLDGPTTANTSYAAICRNPHSSSNWDSRITRQLGYKKTFCVHKKSLLVTFFSKYNMHRCLSFEDRPRFLRLLQNYVSAGYDKFLFHERCGLSCSCWEWGSVPWYCGL